MINGFEPAYLKVAPTNPEDNKYMLPFVVGKNNGYWDRQSFGHFKIAALRTKDNAGVLEFCPYSRDCGFEESRFPDREEALGASIDFLREHGYRAKDFDFWDMIDKI